MNDKENLKVLFVGACSFPEYGGASSRALHLQAKGMAELGVDVHVVTQSSTLEKRKQEHDGFRLTSAIKYSNARQTRLARIATNGHFSAIVTENILYEENDVVIVYGISPQFLLFKALARAKKKKFAVVIGDTLERGDTRFLYRSIERILLERAFLIIVNGSRELEERVNGWRTESKIIRIWPPVDVEFFSEGNPDKARDKFELHAENIIVYAGSVNSLEGVLDLLDAIAILARNYKKEFTLAIAGHEAEKDPVTGRKFCVTEEAKKRGVHNHLRYLGVLSSNEIRDLYALASVLVNPKIDHEINRMAAPIKIGEYLASGTPIISSRLPNLEDWLRHEEEVLFYNPGDSQELSRMIINVLERKYDLAVITDKAAKKAKEVCSHRVWANSVIGAINEKK